MKRQKPMDISGLPELKRIIAQVRANSRPLVLQADGEDVAVITPVQPRETDIDPRPTRADDPIWRLVGAGRSEGPGDVSTNKQKYLAEAYMPNDE